MRLSLSSYWESEDEKAAAEAVSVEEMSDEEKGDEWQTPAAVREEEEWMDSIHAVDIPLPHLRSTHQPSSSAKATPMQLLQLFLSPNLMEEFAAHTNAAAPHGWRPVSVSELYAFIGAQVFMGINPLPQTYLYWDETFANHTLTSVFSRDRFKQLQRFFRVTAVDEDSPERDPMPFVRSLAAKLNAIFPQHFTPMLHLTLDEAMVAYKGRAFIKQYIPSKPHKWGYKIYCLCSEGYLLGFEIYEGKEERKSEMGATYDTVLRMVGPYAGKEYVLSTDSWFTSPTLLDALKEKGIRLCGSVRKNRKGLPEIHEDDIKSLKRGEWLQRQKGDCAFAVWKDQTVMRVLYNHCSPTEVSSLERWGSSGNKISIGCPRAIQDYFFHSRSVDVLSQLHYAYLIGRKAERCWPRLAWWLVDVCILNAFKLWTLRQEKPSQLAFRISLMNELFDQYHSHRRASQAVAHPPKDIPTAKDHYPENTNEKRDCIVCSHRPHHRVESRVICHVCKVHLCIGACFGHYHAQL
jgi:Transposase IS4